jgi:hypothetical protein
MRRTITLACAGTIAIVVMGCGPGRQTQEEKAPGMRVLPFKKGNRTASISIIAGQGSTVQLMTTVTP